MNEAPAKPLTLNGDLANLPIALRELADKKIWVVWNWQLRKGLWTKPPRRPNGQLAESNNPETWSTYEEVLAAAENHDGIGVMLRDLEIAAADLDKCRDPITGEIEPWAQDIIARLPAAYTEISVSGTGMRLIAQGTGGSVQRKFHINGANGTKGPALELFRRCARFITISANEVGPCDELPNGDALIDTLLLEYDGQRQEKRPRQEESTANGFDWRKEQFLLPEKLLNLIWKGVAAPQRSEQFHHVVAWLKELGWPADGICSILASHPDGIAAKYGNRLRDEVNRSFKKCSEAEQSASAQSQTWATPVDLWAKFDAPELPSGVLSSNGSHAVRQP